jgi:hypothetical protein
MWKHASANKNECSVRYRYLKSLPVQVLLAQTDAENVETLQPHFDKIFNGESRPIDMEEALGMVKQRPTHQELNRPISMSELNEYISRASNEKALGKSQIPADIE